MLSGKSLIKTPKVREILMALAHPASSHRKEHAHLQLSSHCAHTPSNGFRTKLRAIRGPSTARCAAAPVVPPSESGLGSNPPGSIGTASRPATTKLLWEPPACATQRELSITPVRRNPCGNGVRLPLRSEIAELIVIVPATPFAEEALITLSGEIRSKPA